MKNRTTAAGSGLLLLVVGVIVVLRLLAGEPLFDGPTKAPRAPSPASPSSVSSAGEAGEAAVIQAFADERSGVWVEVAGVIERNLADDREGSAHQRFILELPSGHTVLVAHNIDLAPRVPSAEGDRVRLAGQYEWNDRGGVIHWTHHDPQGRRTGGWIEHGGKRYE